MSKEKRFVIQVDPLEIEDDAIFDNKELRLYECQSDMMSDICSLLNKQDQIISNLEAQLAKKQEVRDFYLKRYEKKLKEYDKEITELKQQLATMEKALENAIVPKFKIGQEVYYYHIARNKTYSGAIEDIQWFATRNGIYYRIPQLQRDYFWIREDELFATKEEALAKLKELKKSE